MRMEVKRNRILIIPETDIDIAYIEEVLGMREAHDSCLCINHWSASSIAYVEIKNRRER